MNLALTSFKFVARPVTKWAAHKAFVGRNRSRFEPEQGRFTRPEVNRLLNQTWHIFDETVSDVSKEQTVGSRMNVRLAALTLAFLNSLIVAGIERDYATELIGDACWNIYQNWGRAGHFLARLSRHDPIKDHARRVGQDGSWPMSFPFNPPGYLARYVPTEGGVGFDVIRCPVAEYFRARAATDLAVSTWCMLDYPLAEMLGLRLERTQTLAAGDARCDFRWWIDTRPDNKQRQQDEDQRAAGRQRPSQQDSLLGGEEGDDGNPGVVKQGPSRW